MNTASGSVQVLEAIFESMYQQKLQKLRKSFYKTYATPNDKKRIEEVHGVFSTRT